MTIMMIFAEKEGVSKTESSSSSALKTGSSFSRASKQTQNVYTEVYCSIPALLPNHKSTGMERDQWQNLQHISHSLTTFHLNFLQTASHPFMSSHYRPIPAGFVNPSGVWRIKCIIKSRGGVTKIKGYRTFAGYLVHIRY
jgi:hypothetical protein